MECPDTDQELIEKWRRDGSAMHANILVQRHYSRMLNLFYRLTGTRSQAEELTQELFLRLTEQVARGRAIQQLGAWLNATALNLWRDRIRREMRARAKGIWYSGGDEEIQDLVVSAAQANREAEILSSLEQQSVRDAVLRLAAKHREVVVLYHYQGLKYEEIARVLGIPVGTVRSRLHYAVDELRAYLGQVPKGSHS
jgi:RNA polymerase sigma-70 factor (ECF subfamily)